jgi:hypothetical protein
MENITLEAFIVVMSILVPLAIYMGITEDSRRQKEENSK